MGSESDIGLGNMGIGMGLSFDEQMIEPRKPNFVRSYNEDARNGI